MKKLWLLPILLLAAPALTMDPEHASAEIDTNELKVFMITPNSGLVALAEEKQPFYFKTWFKQSCPSIQFSLELRKSRGPLIWSWTGDKMPPPKRLAQGRYEWRLRAKTQCGDSKVWKKSAWSHWIPFELK